MTDLDYLRSLANYYRDILKILSYSAGKHFLDIGAVLRYGLTVDLGPYLERASDIAAGDLYLKIERISPGAVSQVVEQAAALEEEDLENRSSSSGATAKDEQVLERRTASERLVAIYRKQEQDPFNRETILGWPIVAGKYGSLNFCAPILYFPVRVSYDPTKAVYEIVKEFAEPTLNSYLISRLSDSEEDTPAVRNALAPYLYSGSIDSKAIEHIIRILAEIVSGLRGLQRDERRKAPLAEALAYRGNSGSRMLQTAVLINARRTSPFLQDDLSELARLNQFDAKTVVQTIVQDVADGLDEPEGDNLDPENPLLFPFQSNRAQRMAAKKAEQARLLVIQGPPGTGKSLTIANLVCHLASKGYSVLVTSHQNKALEVVVDMLPKVDYLALSLLKGEKESVAQLVNQLERFSSTVEDRTLHALEESRKRAGASVKRIEADILSLRSRFHELKIIERDTYSNYRKYHEIRAFDRIDPRDSIPPGDDGETARALREWYETSLALSKTVGELDEVFVTYNATVVAATLTELAELVEGVDQLTAQPVPSVIAADLISSAVETPTAQKRFKQYADWLESCKGELVNSRSKCTELGIEASSLELWRSLIIALGRAYVEELLTRARITADTAMKLATSWPPPDDLPADPSADLIQRVIDGLAVLQTRERSWLRWTLSPRARRVRKMLRTEGLGEIDFAERTPRLHQVSAWATSWSLLNATQEGLRFLVSSKLPVATRPLSSPVDLIQSARSAVASATLLSILCSSPEEGDRTLQLALNRCLEGAVSLVEVEHLVQGLRAAAEHHQRRARLKELAATSPVPFIRECCTLLAPYFGRLRSEDRPVIVEKLERLNEALPPYLRLLHLESTTLSSLIFTLRALKVVVMGGKLVEWMEQPEMALAAFRLGRYVRDGLLSSPDDIEQVAAKIRALGEEKRAAIIKVLERTRYVALKLAELDNAARFQIVKLRQLLRRKKKTPSLIELRSQIDFKRLLQVFPCWILSIDDVARVFPLQEGLFDFVIVDEASQCNQATTLHLAFRGQRMIVVGDRQQLKNPHVRFLADADVRLLLAKHGLDKHPKAEFLHGRESLLALAEVSANASVFLNEHFRCEPPIINWSNRHFYDNRLRVLTPIRAKRFVPVAELRLVREADDDPERRQNRPEAMAVVREVVAFCRGPEADGLTVGVISPYESQAALLQNLLHEELADSPQVIRATRLVASTADGFQGDERDIIFYSFRYGPSSSPGTIRAIELERERLNVAFTRARRKIVLFVSVRPEDFPIGLIRDFLQHVSEVERAQAARLPLVTEDRFDSDFEQDVCERLRSRGFIVTTQVPCAGFFIDLVAQDGEGRRLAIECDGQFHYEDDGDLRPEDYQRQDIIERSGWTVHRVSSRYFHTNPDASVDRIIARLKEQPKEEDLVASEVSTGTEVEETELPAEAPTEGYAEGDQVRANRQSESLWTDQQVSEPPSSRSAPSGPTGDDILRIATAWFDLSHWGKVTGKLSPYVNKFSYGVGRILGRGWELTPKQVKFARRVWALATSLGWRPPVDSDEATG